MKKITQEIVKNIFIYDKETGYFLWKNNSRIAGYLTANGYRRVFFSGRAYMVHRLIWLYMNGEWPDKIDHINGVRHDNRWINLRNVDHFENMKNKAIQKNNISGICGVFWNKNKNTWMSQIQVNNKIKHIGCFREK